MFVQAPPRCQVPFAPHITPLPALRIGYVIHACIRIHQTMPGMLGLLRHDYGERRLLDALAREAEAPIDAMEDSDKGLED